MVVVPGHETLLSVHVKAATLRHSLGQGMVDVHDARYGSDVLEAVMMREWATAFTAASSLDASTELPNGWLCVMSEADVVVRLQARAGMAAGRFVPGVRFDRKRGGICR